MHTLQTVRVPLGSTAPLERVTPWLREDARPFVLQGEWLGSERTTIVGSRPVRLADPRSEDPFALLDAMPAIDPGAARIGGGWVGWLGYGLGARIEQLPPSPPPVVPRPAYSLAFYDHVLIKDEHGWWFEALSDDARSRAMLSEWRRRLAATAGAGPTAPAARATRVGPFAVAGNGAAGHLAAIVDCRRRIAEGELFQANLCVRLEAELDGEPLGLLDAALTAAAPRFGACVDGVLSLSPERFLRRRGRVVWSEPIKGTRPRRGDEAAQSTQRAALEASGKDAAEHVMIVDLMRNDLGRVCRYGTIEAHQARVEPHAGVWHLVSTVSGGLRDGVGDGELLRATFPPGSVTGAPKIQAMKVIAALESTRREAYTGAIGIASPIAGLDLSVAIRTFETGGGRIWLGVGGGIVADSDPEEELEEALVKASGPVAAIGGRTATTPPSPAVILNIEPALAHGRRPDPARGVFETILADGGRAVRLPQHVGRLAASLEQLYGVALGPDIARLVEAEASSGTRLRIRVLAGPDGTVTVMSEPAPAVAADAPPVRLIPYLLPGGLGAHKWRDRDLVDALGARSSGTVPLFIDADGAVLEAGHANVLIAEGDALVTSPADGRILPGVTRAGLLGTALEEEPIDLARLRAADAIFLTSAISGRRPAVLAR